MQDNIAIKNVANKHTNPIAFTREDFHSLWLAAGHGWDEMKLHHHSLALVESGHLFPLLGDQVADAFGWRWSAIIVAIIIAMDSPNGVVALSWFLAHLWRMSKVGLIFDLVTPRTWVVHLQTIERLPGSDDFASLRIGPHMMRQEVEMIQLHHFRIISHPSILDPLNSDLLTTEELGLLERVVIEEVRVAWRVCAMLS